MGCENPISAYVDHDMPNFPNICFLPGSPTLPLNNARFCKLVLVAFAEKTRENSNIFCPGLSEKS